MRVGLLVALTVAGLAFSAAVSGVAHAQEIQLSGPLASSSGSPEVVLFKETQQTPAEQQSAVRGSRVALARHGCITEDSAGADAVKRVHAVLAGARALWYANKKGEEENALDALESARLIAHLPAIEQLDAEIHLASGHIAHARAALEAHATCSRLKDPLGKSSLELERLRERTATVNVSSSGRRIVVDGVTLMTNHITLYAEAGGGSHTISVEDELGITQERSFAFSGGEIEHIEIESSGVDGDGDGDGAGGERRRHRSSPRRQSSPWRDRSRFEPIGLSIGIQSAVDTAGGHQATHESNPMAWGPRIAMFARSGNRESELRGGVFGAPSGSSKGFNMPIGVSASAHLFTPSVLALGLGVSSGYLVAPNASRTIVDNFEPRPSFFVEPHIPISFALGELELETRMGLMWSAQEDAVRSRFALSYVTIAAGVTWVPRKSF